MPIAVIGAGANVPDTKLAAPTLDAQVVERPDPTAAQPQHLCLDGGYDYDLPCYAAEQRHYIAPIRPSGEDRANADAEYGSRPLCVKKGPAWRNGEVRIWANCAGNGRRRNRAPFCHLGRSHRAR